MGRPVKWKARLLKERTDFCFAKICRCQLDIVNLVNDQNFELSEHILEVCELVSPHNRISWSFLSNMYPFTLFHVSENIICSVLQQS